MNTLRYALIVTLLTVCGTRPALAQSKGLLWQITGKSIQKPTYLYGTIHLFDTSMYRLPQPVMTKLAQTKQVYFELDFAKINPAEVMQFALITDSTQYLNNLLDSASLRKLDTIIAASPTLKMFGPIAYRLKPLLLTTLLLNNGNAVTIDMELYKLAQKQQIKIGGLETMAEQMQAINTITIGQQVQMVQEFLKTYTTGDDLIRKLTEIYVKQDIQTLLQEMNNDAPIDASFNEALLTRRNLVMLNRMIPLFGNTSTMIAVGAGHLSGPKGLIALLKQKGYQVKSVPFVFAKAH
jgi:uncharacterized protein